MVELCPVVYVSKNASGVQETTRSAGGQPGRHRLTHLPYPPARARPVFLVSFREASTKFFAASDPRQLGRPGLSCNGNNRPRIGHSLPRQGKPNGHGSLSLAWL